MGMVFKKTHFVDQFIRPDLIHILTVSLHNSVTWLPSLLMPQLLHMLEGAVT